MEPDVGAAPRAMLQTQTIDVDGAKVGVAMAGRGATLVLLHGFGVESMLYAQTLSRRVMRQGSCGSSTFTNSSVHSVGKSPALN